MTSLIQIHEPGETPLPHEAGETAPAIGIDLGTTYSVVAVVRDGAVHVLKDPDGEALLPSVVAYPLADESMSQTSAPKVLVGRSAQRLLLSDPDAVVVSVKRLMGKGLKDIPQLQSVLPYDMTDELKAALATQQSGMIKLDVYGKLLTPVEISADILRTLKQRAEMVLGQTVTQAVITVPAYFDDAARAATKDAARLAGLQVLRLLNEPTAAAVAYGLDRADQGQAAGGLYLIYDLGGGTFDVSILRLEQGVFQVLATGGDTQLGGDDIDAIIANYWRTQYLSAQSVEPKQLQQTARQAKEFLSMHDVCEVQLGDDDERLTFHLNRQTLSQLVQPILSRTLNIVDAVMRDAQLTPNDLHGVVLVGGSTRMPMVRTAVSKHLGHAPKDHVDPDQVVAVGAARQAHALTTRSGNLLLDVTPLSLGMETMGGLMERMIERNTPIPCTRAQDFSTYVDNQTAIKIHVLQGERELAKDNRSLAQFDIRGIPPIAAGQPRLRVTFSIDADGILSVSADEQTSGLMATVDVKPTYGLSEADMQRMIMEASIHSDDDLQQRLLIEQQAESQRLIAAVEKMLSVQHVEAGLLAHIQQLTHTLQQQMQGRDRNLIRTTKEQLEKLVMPVVEQQLKTVLQTVVNS